MRLKRLLNVMLLTGTAWSNVAVFTPSSGAAIVSNSMVGSQWRSGFTCYSHAYHFAYLKQLVEARNAYQCGVRYTKELGGELKNDLARSYYPIFLSFQGTLAIFVSGETPAATQYFHDVNYVLG